MPQLLDVPEIKSEFSGRSGFEKHFAEMLGDQTGKFHHEMTLRSMFLFVKW